MHTRKIAVVLLVVVIVLFWCAAMAYLITRPDKGQSVPPPVAVSATEKPKHNWVSIGVGDTRAWIPGTISPLAADRRGMGAVRYEDFFPQVIHPWSVRVTKVTREGDKVTLELKVVVHVRTDVLLRGDLTLTHSDGRGIVGLGSETHPRVTREVLPPGTYILTLRGTIIAAGSGASLQRGFDEDWFHNAQEGEWETK